MCICELMPYCFLHSLPSNDTEKRKWISEFTVISNQSTIHQLNTSLKRQTVKTS